MTRLDKLRQRQYAELTVELTNICNLHCSYCLRDDDALHHSPATFLPVDLLRQILEGARQTYGVEAVSFTGGEVTLHPQFREIIETVASARLTASFVTNGWHFDRVYTAVLANRHAISQVAFSLDGATAAAHDRWRGKGSYVRVIRAMARCYAKGIPFSIKVSLHRDIAPQLEEVALLAAKLGAASLQLSHFLPTSLQHERELNLTLAERQRIEEEIALLKRILKMPIKLGVGYYNTDPEPPCYPLLGKSCNVDYRGRLTLCCNLSGYEGAAGEDDVTADLTKEDFAIAYARLQDVAKEQVERRRLALAAAQSGDTADLYTASPCLFCMQRFRKIPWRDAASVRSLPILQRL